MGRRAQGGAAELAAEAARIYVEDALTDYGEAKRRAAERMGLSTRTGLPDNARVQAQVIAYQQLFGGEEYIQRLQLLRRTAVQTLRWLAIFDARLVGAVVSGAISDAHRVQLHAFPEQPERVDIFLLDRGMHAEQDERDYRYGDGRVQTVPLARFMAGDVGVDVALFSPGDERRPPLSSADGKPTKRLTLAQAEVLAIQPVHRLR